MICKHAYYSTLHDYIYKFLKRKNVGLRKKIFIAIAKALQLYDCIIAALEGTALASCPSTKTMFAFWFTQKLKFCCTPFSSLKAVPECATLIKSTHRTRSGSILVWNVNKVSLKDIRIHLAAHCGAIEAWEGQEAPLALSWWFIMRLWPNLSREYIFQCGPNVLYRARKWCCHEC